MAAETTAMIMELATMVVKVVGLMMAMVGTYSGSGDDCGVFGFYYQNLH